MKAYSYTRISTPEQINGHGPARQQDGIAQYCERKGLELDQTPLADLGLSGFHGTNLSKGALGEFRDSVLAKPPLIPVPCALVVEDLDRISRKEPQYALPIFFELISAGVEIHTTEDNVVYRDGEVDLGKIVLATVKFGRGYDESRMKSVRKKKSLIKQRENYEQNRKPMTRAIPEWLEIKKDSDKITPIPERVAIVQRIFEEVAEGRGKNVITARLNEEGIKTWGKGLRQGVRWHDSYISKILNGRAVLGEFQTHSRIRGIRIPTGPIYPDYYPKVITEELWQAAQKSLATRAVRHDANPDAPKNLVPQLVYIDGIRARWIDKGNKTTSNGKRGSKKPNPHGGRWIYYQTFDPSTGKTLSTIPALEIETMILSALKKADGNTWVRLLKDETTTIDPKVSMRRSLEFQIQRRKEAIDRLLNALALGVGGQASIATKIADEEKRLLEEQEKLAALGSEIITNNHIPPKINELQKLAESGDTSNPEIRDALKRRLIGLIARVDIGRTLADMMTHHNTLDGNTPFVIAPGMLDLPAAEGPHDKKMLWALLTLKDTTGLARLLVTSRAPDKNILAVMKVKASINLWGAATTSSLPEPRITKRKKHRNGKAVRVKENQQGS